MREVRVYGDRLFLARVLITFLTLAAGQSAERELTGKALTVTNEFNISSSSSMKKQSSSSRGVDTYNTSKLHVNFHNMGTFVALWI